MISPTNSGKFFHKFLFFTVMAVLMGQPINAFSSIKINQTNHSTVANIDRLRHLEEVEGKKIEHGDVIYVIGYYHSGDKGGGYFSYDNDLNKTKKEDFGINFKSKALPGFWTRINYDFVTIAHFGALGGDLNDDTKAIQNAIDYQAKQNPPGTLYFSRGVYYMQQMILKNGVSLNGEFRGTIIRPYKISDSTYAESLVVLDDGPVSNVRIDGLYFQGDYFNSKEDTIRRYTPMDCFELNANATNGGLWFSTIKNVVITGFEGDALRLVGGTNYTTNNQNLRFNQFISFENFRITKSKSEFSRALYMYGQNAQIDFNNCNFDGSENYGEYGTCIYIESNEFYPYEGFQSGPQTSLINFRTSTFQNTDIAIEMHGVYNINVDACWFENVQRSLIIKDECRGISINRNKFSNAGSSFILQMEDSWVQFMGNVIRQKTPVKILKDGRKNKYFGRNNYYESQGTLDQYRFN